ncbi:MAG: serine/threonine protein kinase, partial [Gemmataceae bacterium]|nr:serine/threonine protein kinase [Gemmataceae bacterium]
WDAGRPGPPPAAGPEVPGYTLGGEVGRGGMGVVYRAVRRADGAAVAVKLVRPADGVGRREVEKFVREARLLAELDHPHVVRHLDSGEAGGSVYLVMELVDGPDAGRMLRARGRLPVGTAVRIAAGVLAALGYAHRRGTVHRDVKPANVLVGGPRTARVTKLADFGLARKYDDCRLSGLTLQGEVEGTLGFVAPEPVTHYREARPAADQYAAAATLFALLAGRPPRDLPGDIRQQLVAVVTAEPVPIRDLRPELPAGLAAVVHKALARDPADRFPDVTAFRRALGPFGG